MNTTDTETRYDFSQVTHTLMQELEAQFTEAGMAPDTADALLDEAMGILVTMEENLGSRVRHSDLRRMVTVMSGRLDKLLAAERGDTYTQALDALLPLLQDYTPGLHLRTPDEVEADRSSTVGMFNAKSQSLGNAFEDVVGQVLPPPVEAISMAEATRQPNVAPDKASKFWKRLERTLDHAYPNEWQEIVVDGTELTVGIFKSPGYPRPLAYLHANSLDACLPKFYPEKTRAASLADGEAGITPGASLAPNYNPAYYREHFQPFGNLVKSPQSRVNSALRAKIEHAIAEGLENRPDAVREDGAIPVTIEGETLMACVRPHNDKGNFLLIENESLPAFEALRAQQPAPERNWARRTTAAATQPSNGAQRS